MTLLSDPIGDLLTRIRNAQAAGRTECRAPWSRLKQRLCELLKREEWLADVQVVGDKPKQELLLSFRSGRSPLILKRVSKPGRRVYSSTEELDPVLRGFGMAVLTTSQGLMTDKEARKKKIGGEVLCTVA
jgi:small subunit ribosomal protein S8